jgi:hypothetical protein
MPTPPTASRSLGLHILALLLAAIVVNARALAQHGSADTLAPSHARNSSSSVDSWAGQIVATAKDDGRIVACLDEDGLPARAIPSNCPGTLHHLRM